MTTCEMTVLDNDGYPLTVAESVHTLRMNAIRHASKCALEYAARYPGATTRKSCAGDFFLVADSNGKTFAQFAVR